MRLADWLTLLGWASEKLAFLHILFFPLGIFFAAFRLFLSTWYFSSMVLEGRVLICLSLIQSSPEQKATYVYVILGERGLEGSGPTLFFSLSTSCLSSYVYGSVEGGGVSCYVPLMG